MFPLQHKWAGVGAGFFCGVLPISGIAEGGSGLCELQGDCGRFFKKYGLVAQQRRGEPELRLRPNRGEGEGKRAGEDVDGFQLNKVLDRYAWVEQANI